MTPRQILTASPVIPVIAIRDPGSAVDLAHALVAGGIRTLEITLRTEHGLSAIGRIRKEVPQAIVGAGTVVNGTQLQAVADAGALFAISPGFNVKLGDSSLNSPIPLIPGIATAGELMLALEYGIDTLKFFPAEAAGGTALLKSLYGPFAQAAFCPTGGIGLHNAASYLQLPNVLCVGGSWLTPADAVAARDWDTVTRLAAEAATLGDGV